ncbi:hypothetical protein [Glutamicibacter sp. V16R2B1]|uniref:hypothetical protein n=1 Tax=Glutamicibacter sp. V16R2B1 TaxID=2036207 RepID=UPI0010FE7396|nr:hypothetical protein [Glutamicibacter sp. V16R2B1]MCK9901328.1 hypothetical protein [Frankia sp. Cpl3]TLK47820.1 hypothetical protein FDN03_15670 [Glutamicibacter sp. V16R2B1]
MPDRLTPDVDLSAPAGADTNIHDEYVITRTASAPIILDHLGGRSVANGIVSGLAPLPPGERLWRRQVTTVTTTTAWVEVTDA